MSTSEFKLNLAVVIGINAYQNGIPALGTARQDAEALAEILERDYQYQVHLITESEATSENLMRWLETELPEAIERAAPSRFLFYFAGHGIALNGDDGPEGYLILHNSRLGEVSSYLSMTKVYEALIKLSCRHFLGILDCCFAGAFRWCSTRKLVPIELGTIHKERFDRFIQDPAWQVITSAAYDQTALDNFDLKDDRGQKGGHSPFAAILIEALQGKADAYPAAESGKPAGDGVITATELYLYLRDRLELETEAHSMRQTPGICPLKKHDKGEYIFLAPGHPLNLPPAPPLDVSSNPYRGLESFDEAHKDLFFGRKALTQQLSEFVATHSLTVVLSASGAGKSSLVKAGLIPTLRQRQEWHLLPPFRPGESPFKALDQAVESLNLLAVGTSATDGSIALDTPAASSDLPALAQRLAHWFKAHPQAHLLVVVDQLEEIITLCRDEQERQQFLTMLAEALASYPTQLHLVLTLRSDFEPQFRNTALEQGWQAARFVVPAMTREELRQAIEEPASARVMYFAPHELVDQLIDEVTNMPGALPLLSFALSELYLNYLKRQEDARNRGETLDRAITQSDYEELGGVTRSLTQRAERECEVLIEEDLVYEHTIRNVMLRMVSVGGELARRRVPLSELEYPEFENKRVQTVLERFETARLITPGTDSEGQPYQEPAHDALVRGWKRLLDWKQQYLAALILQRELTSDASQWKTSSQKKRDSGLLWIEDPRLPAALQLSCGKAYKDTWINLFKWRFGYQAWQSQPRDCWFNQSESDFVWQSFNQRFQRFGKTTITIAGVMLILSGIAIYAVQRAAIAQLREQSARVLNFLPTTNRASGLVLAIDTMDRSEAFPSVEITAQDSLLKALQVSQETNRFGGHKDAVLSVAFSPNGQRIVSGSTDKTLRLWDTQTGKPVGQPLAGHGSTVWSVAFSPNGRCIVSGSSDKTLRLWDAQTGASIGQPLIGHDNKVFSVAFSPDGKRIVSGSNDKTLRLWDAQTGEPVGQPLAGHEDEVFSVAFSPNGQRIVSGSLDGTLRLWDAQTGEPVSQPLGRGAGVLSVAFSPDGKRIISGSADKTLRLWDAQTGEPVGQPLAGHGDAVRSVAFSHNGQRIVSGSLDKTLRLWDAQTGKPVGQPIEGYGADVYSVAYSPDGQRIVSSGFSKTLRLWDAQTSVPHGQPLEGHGDTVRSVAFSPDGKRIVSGSEDKTLRLWDAQTGAPIGQPLGYGAAVWSVAFSPNGQRIVSGSEDNTLRLWDAQTGASIGQPLEGHGSGVWSVAFSPDGQRIVSGSLDGTLRLWDAQTGASVGQPLKGHGSVVRSVAFSPDSQRIVSGSADNALRLWDAQTGKPIGKPLIGHAGSVRSVAFSPDGQRIVSGSEDNTLRLWDAQTNVPIGQRLEGHRSEVISVAFSPDGQRIVSGSGDNTLRLWNAQTGAPIGQPLEGHDGKVWSVAFSPDGKRIVSGSGDNTLRLWDVSPAAWIDLACRRLQYHPLLNQPETMTNDPEFINVAKRSKAVCEQREWGHSERSSPVSISWGGRAIHRIASLFGR